MRVDMGRGAPGGFMLGLLTVQGCFSVVGLGFRVCCRLVFCCMHEKVPVVGVISKISKSKFSSFVDDSDLMLHHEVHSVMVPTSFAGVLFIQHFSR